tara:strand:- start:42 stop:584 length:543 start_codon:yes stop_codon:yes gene_type:complete
VVVSNQTQPITFDVTLEDGFAYLVKWLARERAREADEPLVHTHRTADRVELFTHSIGAEFAFAQLFNVCPSTAIHERRVWDFDVDGWGQLDIKHTQLSYGNLIINPAKETHKVSGYVLMAGRYPDYQFRGWATPGDVFEQGEVKTFASKVYLVKKENLRPAPQKYTAQAHKHEIRSSVTR